MRQIDEERLTRLVAEHAAVLVLYARQWVDGASADDVVQDALIALLTRQRLPADPIPWMYRVVRNAAIDFARATERRRRREQSIAQARVEWLDPHFDSLFDAKTAEQSLRQLRADYREVVVLRIWGDLGFAEIAEIMQIGVSTVHGRYKAALNELRVVLEKTCPTKSN